MEHGFEQTRMPKTTLRKFLLIGQSPLRKAMETADAALAVDHRKICAADLATRFRSLGAFGPGFDEVSAVALFSRACLDTLGFLPRANQLACGLVMARGSIVEMDTGEGKTVSTALASCLLALGGDGVHSVTVNPYLAARDYALLSPLYASLGLSSSLISHGMSAQDRISAYATDIVHGANAEFVFDRLRDGLALDASQIVQRGHASAVVDEADSVLLDEASTPLVLSDGTGTVSDAALFCDLLVGDFSIGTDYEIEEEDGFVHLTPSGMDRAEQALKAGGFLPNSATLFDGRSDILGHLDAAMKARLRLVRDRDYIVRDRKIEIVDANTGRVLDGRRYADGLHEAVEIKEGVPHVGSGDIVSSTTYMNYFALYRRLCGTSGTAMSSSSELERLYRIPTLRVPPHRPSRREDHADRIHATSSERNEAVVEEAVVHHLAGRPVLIGTGTVAESLEIAKLLEARGFAERSSTVPARMTYALLNASRADHEADVVASAGRVFALTVATNMAGRGTDIVAGGGDIASASEVLALGGLHVIGVGRHLSRRIDDQLRGRAGRRGEPGSTRFHVSLEDELLRHSYLPSSALAEMLASGREEDMRVLVDSAQRVATATASDMRENLRQYSAIDTVQIEAFHRLRRDFMSSEIPYEIFEEMRSVAIRRAFVEFVPEGTYPEQWNVSALRSALLASTAIDFPLADWAAEDDVDGDVMMERVFERLDRPPLDAATLKAVVLSSFDVCWREHVARLEVLRRAVAFRTYALLQPLTEYRVESFPLFERLLVTLSDRVASAVAWAAASGPVDHDNLRTH